MVLTTTQKVNLEVLREMGLDTLLNAENVISVINSSDVDALRDLIVNVSALKYRASKASPCVR